MKERRKSQSEGFLMAGKEEQDVIVEEEIKDGSNWDEEREGRRVGKDRKQRGR